MAQAEWQKIKQQGVPPCGRTGHSMSFLPMTKALLVAGGRNDAECKNKQIPFLDDMYLFLLDQKSWINVKYVPSSQRICYIGNHAATVATDHETFEKVIIFGGITNHLNPGATALTNQMF